MSSAEASSKIKVVLPRQRQVHQRRKKTTKKSSLQDEVDRYCQGAAEEAFNVVLASFPDKIKALEEVRSELSIDTLWPGETDTDWVGESLRAWTKDKDKVSDENCVQDSSMRPGLFECYQGRGNNNTKAGVMVKLHDTPRMMIETNDTVHRLIQRLKPFLVELLEQLDQLVFGIQMLVPHIQEGNNFGVEVQQKALGLLENIYEETSSMLQDLGTYYHRRQQSLQLMMAHPNVADYRQCLRSLDYSQLNYLCCEAFEHLYSAYTLVHDFMGKHLELILCPRADDS